MQRTDSIHSEPAEQQGNETESTEVDSRRHHWSLHWTSLPTIHCNVYVCCSTWL